MHAHEGAVPNKTIFEASDPVSSPSGIYTVAVSSQTSLADQGLSQAVASEPNGGSGLIAFYSPRVSMEFVWKSDDELVVRYPNVAAAKRDPALLDAAIKRANLDGQME